MFCEHCGKEVNEKASVCINCGCAINQTKRASKNILKRWWFWVIVVVVVFIIAISNGGDSQNANNTATQSADKNTSKVETVYEQVDLQVMFRELEENAMKAEENYQNKYVEIIGKISNFDSDGSYISIEPVSASEWNFNTMLCNIKNDEQKQLLMEKSVGDTITVQGKVTSIGEVLGYSMDIDDIK